MYSLTPLLILCLAAIVGSTSSPAYSDVNTSNSKVESCVKLGPSEVLLQGAINAEMEECAFDLIDNMVEKVFVKSMGGNVDHAKTIGYLIGTKKRTIVVREICVSSCANYLLPTATELTIESGSLIGIHGTPDPRYFEIHREQFQEQLVGLNDKKRLEKNQLYDDHTYVELQKEEQFAAHFDIRKGWRLYRGIGDADNSYLEHMSGAPFDDVPTEAYIIIARKLLIESCLPNLASIRYENQNDTIGVDLKHSFPINIKLVSSGNLRCTDD